MQYQTARKGFVSGDWWYDAIAEKYTHVYPAKIEGTWNGWAEPVVDRATAERIIADQKKMADVIGHDDGVPKLKMSGDKIMGYDPSWEDDWTVWAEPDAAGLYHVGFGWTWERCNEDGSPFTPDAEVDDEGPTPKQLQAFEKFSAQFTNPWTHVHSGSRIVNDDGSHSFPVAIKLGEQINPGGATRLHTHHVGWVNITRKGDVHFTDRDDSYTGS